MELFILDMYQQSDGIKVNQTRNIQMLEMGHIS
jgi:hypothetical protein